MSSRSITFRPLRREDFPLLAGWLAEPLGWCHDSSAEAVEGDFGPSVDGRDATEMLLAVVAGRPVGLIQRYPVASWPSSSRWWPGTRLRGEPSSAPASRAWPRAS